MNKKMHDMKINNYKIKSKLLIVFFVFSFFIFVYFLASFNWNTNSFASSKINSNISKLFSFNNYDKNYPSSSILNNSIKYMFVTIRIVSLGTLIGFILGILTSVISTKEIFRKISYLIKAIIIFLRAFPVIIFIYATQEGFEKELAATLILSWFTWLWSSKYLTDMFETANKFSYKMSIKKGQVPLIAFNKEIIGRSNDKIFSLFLYSFESNLRWSTLLGSLGIIGIGEFINSNIPLHYENIGYPLLVLLIVVLFFEMVIWLFNKYIMSDKTTNFTKKYHLFNYRKMIKIITAIFFVVIAIYSISQLEWNFSRISGFNNYIEQLFNPNISSWSSSSANENPWFMLFDIFKQCYVIVFITTIFSVIVAAFSSQKIVNSYLALLVKFLISIIRVIPIFLIFRILNAYFISPISLSIIAVSLHSITILSQQFVRSINNIQIRKINQLEKQGYSFIWRVRYYILPSISKEAAANIAFLFVNVTRTVLILGIMGTSILGSKIDALNSKLYLQELFGYVWPLTIYLLIWEIILENIKIKTH